MLTLYADTDQVLIIPDVTDRDGTAQEAADVQVTLARRNGQPVDGTWPQPATHVEGGTYEFLIDDSLPIRNIARAIIDITLPDGETRTRLVDEVYIATR
jgi:hypothetical protein